MLFFQSSSTLLECHVRAGHRSSQVFSGDHENLARLDNDLVFVSDLHVPPVDARGARAHDLPGGAGVLLPTVAGATLVLRRQDDRGLLAQLARGRFLFLLLLLVRGRFDYLLLLLVRGRLIDHAAPRRGAIEATERADPSTMYSVYGVLISPSCLC